MRNFSENIPNPPHIIPPEEDFASENPEQILYVPKFKHIQEDLRSMFQINVPDESYLNNRFIKNEMNDAVIRELKQGTPFALDYFIEEGLLTQEDFRKEDLPLMKTQADKILRAYKGPRFTRAKELFVGTGIMSEEEAEKYPHPNNGSERL